MNDVLIKLGFTKNESKVYLGFLKDPGKTAAEMGRLLHMDKSSTYKSVDNLTSKGFLIREGWKDGTTYSAANPTILRNIIAQNEIQVKEQKHLLDTFIQTIQKESRTKDRSTYLAIDRGIEGLKLRMTESLESKEKLIRECFRNFDIYQNTDTVQFIKEFAKERVRRKIHIRELQTKENRLSGTTLFGPIMTDLKRHLKEQRDLPASFDEKNGFSIYDDTAFILSYDDAGEFIILTIKDKYIVSLLKNLYDFLWEQSTPVKEK